jgi:cytochrome b subunit of formate dehydrogenase
MSEQKQYLRFSVAQRIEHWVQMLSFTGLALTGIPQKFVGSSWAETMIQVMGGIELVRTIHHISATLLALACIYHVVVVAYKVFVLRVRWTMFPRLDDLFDALDVVRYNLGLTRERIKLDRFSFEEKAEYWAFVWGAVLMGFTGFMMWNPINTARFLPGDLIPAAKAAHGGEALLAVLAIVVWHFYGVHIKTFSKAMFTGKLSEHQMEHEHTLELERIQTGVVDPLPDPETVKKRERVFIPVAAILSALMLVTLYLFVTYEQTAITTSPRRAQVQIYAPITPTPTPRAGAPAPTLSAAAKPLPDDHVGRTTCNDCHAKNIGPNLPADHAGRTDATCSACHKLGTAPAAPTSAATSAPATKPAVATAAPTSAPATKPAATAAPATAPATSAAPGTAPTTSAAPGTAPATKPAAATAAATAPASSAGPKPIPADHTGRTTCTVCHETGAVGPKSPDDHAGRTDAMCVACHKPQ